MKVHFADLDLLVVTDGAEQYAPEEFAPGIPPEQVQDLLLELGISRYQFVLPSNILVLRHAGRVILFDAGNGQMNGPQAGMLPANLAAAGISTDDITDILISHMHSDHTGGLFNKAGNAVFPNARIHVSQQEYDGWMSDTPDLSKSRKLDAGTLQSMQRRIRNSFAQMGSALQCFSPGTPLFECITPILAAGHTPGHCMFEISRHGQSFLHICDIAHDEALLFAKPEWGTIFDTDFDMAAQTRRKVLSMLAQSRQPVFGYHLPWPGFGHVGRREQGFRWMPLRIPSPQWPVML